MTQVSFHASKKGHKLDFKGYKGRKCMSDAEEFMRLMRELGVDMDTESVEEKPEIHEVGVDERVRTRG